MAIDPCAQSVYEVDKGHRPMCVMGLRWLPKYIDPCVQRVALYVLYLEIDLLFCGPDGNFVLVSSC